MVNEILADAGDLVTDVYHRRHEVADAIITLVCRGSEIVTKDSASLARVIAGQLRRVNYRYRGLSIEPLWEGIEPDLEGIDWVIVGGESGGGARAFNFEWARYLRDRCQENDVAFSVKKLGARPVENGQPISLRDAHDGDWSEWPEVLRVREFPVEWACALANLKKPAPPHDEEE